MEFGDYLECPRCRNSRFNVQMITEGVSIQCMKTIRHQKKMRVCEYVYEDGKWMKRPCELNEAYREEGIYLKEDDENE